MELAINNKFFLKKVFELILSKIKCQGTAVVIESVSIGKRQIFVSV